MILSELIAKVLDPLNSLKDDTNDAVNTTPYILRRLSEFTDGELESLISRMEHIQEIIEHLEEAGTLPNSAQETVAENEK
ncbi:MAG TPA: hypothetical protein DEF35_08795 [Paenibacillus sp.]|uniref:hypothetical protein n=1 Tax=Paenibacillus TaxID=44249 RepID=UPI000BA00A0B|nr:MULTISPECIES: hypothetical protein [Paenibacillus]OZQ64330.1 hypothetical protein CA599_22465 [Paenibacillus taichungensis]HBU81722.1 hypothetical protein [Paenibacillus sp.]